MKIMHDNPTALAKRIFFIAYESCGGVLGMGVFREKSDVTEEQLWDNLVNAGDYSYNPRRNPSKTPYADYCFGRMMKFGLTINTDSIEISDREPHLAYQGWSKFYSTYQSLVDAAIDSLKEEGVNAL